jgi:A/G-specific adenine glycosylase
MNSLPLQKWFINHQRDLPFRHTTNPYLIWVSEVMLQQTQVETMVPFYKQFIRMFPTIETLAKANLETVLTVVQGIGYYRRFRLLHQGAQYVVKHHQGVFPEDYDAIRQIPSIGQYTAGAIMSIAFNQPFAATDGNVLRVLSRFYHFEDDINLKKSMQFLQDKNQKIVMQGPPNIITPALMELGALICRPKQPQCKVCPLQSQCLSLAKNTVDIIPFKSQKKKPKIVRWSTLVVIYNNNILLQKNEEGLLQDMYLLPQTQEDDYKTFIKNLLVKDFKVKPSQIFIHQFTHQTWHMQTYHITTKKLLNIPGMIWVDFEKLVTIPIPEAHKKILRSLTR